MENDKNSLGDKGLGIRLDKKKGRSLMSLTQRLPGEVIIQEKAIITCVFPEFQHSICHSCLLSPLRLLRCSACKRARYCNRECQKADWNVHRAECEISCSFAADKAIPTLIKLLIRLLKVNEQLLKSRRQADTDAFCTEIQVMGSQEKLPETTKEMFSQYVQLICDTSNREQQVYNPKLAYRALEKLYTNTYSIVTEELVSVAAGVYSLASLLNHSCRPNCIQRFCGNQISIRGLERVGAGEELTVSYIDTVQGLGGRREELMKGYLFKCECPRCVRECIEPTELGKFSKIMQEVNWCRNQNDWTGILRRTQHLFDATDNAHVYDRIRITEQRMDSHIELRNWKEAAAHSKIISQCYAEIGLSAHHPLVGINLVKLAKLLLQLGSLEEGMECIERGTQCVRVSYGEAGVLWDSLREMYSVTRTELIHRHR